MPKLTTYVATCRATGMTFDDARAVHAALLATSARMTASGEDVRYLHSSYLPDRHRWFGVFAAGGPHVVRRIARIVQLFNVEVHRAVEFPAHGAEASSRPTPARPLLDEAGVTTISERK